VSLVEETDSTVTLSSCPRTRRSLHQDRAHPRQEDLTPVRSVFHSPNRNRADIRFENVVLNRDPLRGAPSS
jgi:hypothetical protein